MSNLKCKSAYSLPPRDDNGVEGTWWPMPRPVNYFLLKSLQKQPLEKTTLLSTLSVI